MTDERLTENSHPSSSPTSTHVVYQLSLHVHNVPALKPMARRSAAPNSGPTYYSRSAVTGRPGIQDLDEVESSAFSRFMSEEIWAPEKLPGNVAIATSVGVFVAGIYFVRKFGDLIIP